MKTVFYLQGSHCQSNVMELAGATRAAKAFDWNLRIIEYGDSMMNRWHLGEGKSLRERLRELADFWKPLGVIVDCGAAPAHFHKGEFAPLPTVFLDRHPSSIERGAACVYSDSDDIGKTAARELMALGNRTFAFAPWPDMEEKMREKGIPLYSLESFTPLREFDFLGFTLQYTPLNDAMFGWMPFGAKYPLGRLAAMLPYAGAGFLLAAAKGGLDAASRGVRIAAALFGLWLAAFAVYCNVCPKPPSVPGYCGLGYNLTAWGMLFVFYYLPFDRLPEVFSKAVLGISKYCMGVYCFHLLFGQLMFDFVFRCAKTTTSYGEMRLFTITQCLIVWVLSYVCCWLIAKIPFGLFRRVVE